MYKKIIKLLKKHKIQRSKRKRVIEFKKKILKLQKEKNEMRRKCSLDSSMF